MHRSAGNRLRGASERLAVLVAIAVGVPAGAAAGAGVHAADKNCSDFSTQQQAQQYFDSHGGSPSNDVDGLDRDHDGKACESLPSGGGGTTTHHTSPPPALFKGKCKRGPHPDHHCTPGAIFHGLTAQQVCTPGYARNVRNVSTSTKNKVYREYGIRRHRPGAYEVDHLVPLEIGGSNSIRNLWAEKQPGARSKDKLENSLHSDLCAGRLTLHQAQQRIVKWWRY